MSFPDNSSPTRGFVFQQPLLSNSPATITGGNIFDHLDLHPSTFTQDEQSVLRGKSFANEQDVFHAQWLLETEQFGEWYSSANSAILLADASYTDCVSDGVSPFSILCSSLSAIFAQTDQFIILTFFCGLHPIGRDELSYPQGLVRALTSQLVLMAGVGEAPVMLDAALLDRVCSGDDNYIDAICAIFEAVVCSLDSSKKIVCLIDAIDEYEGSRMTRNATVTMVKMFRKLVNSSSLQAKIKILLTCTCIPLNITEYISQEERVTLDSSAFNVNVNLPE